MIATGLGRHATAIRGILVTLGLPQTVIGLYALIAPRGFYEDFPGGRGWVAALGPFDEHLVIDVGATFVAIGVLQLVAAAWPSRRLVYASLLTWSLYAYPHTIYHLTDLGPYDTFDSVANVITLGYQLVAPLIAVALLMRGRRTTPVGAADR
jgi:hypothetical protein